MPVNDAQALPWQPVGAVMPSGRELTSQISAEAKELECNRAHGPGKVVWATLGILSAVGALALYPVVSQNPPDHHTRSAERPSAIKLQENQKDLLQTGSLAVSSPRQWVEPPQENVAYYSLSLDPAPFVEGTHDSAEPIVRAGNTSREIIETGSDTIAIAPNDLIADGPEQSDTLELNISAGTATSRPAQTLLDKNASTSALAAGESLTTLHKPQNAEVITPLGNEVSSVSDVHRPAALDDTPHKITGDDDKYNSVHDNQTQPGNVPRELSSQVPNLAHHVPAFELDTQGKPSQAQQLSDTSNQPIQQLDLDRLVAKGDHLFALGDVASARLVYRLAALDGSATAATAMGSTYDPAYLEKGTVQGTQPNPAQAIKWYKEAITLGATSAEVRLRELTATLENAPALGGPNPK